MAKVGAMTYVFKFVQESGNFSSIKIECHEGYDDGGEPEFVMSLRNLTQEEIASLRRAINAYVKAQSQ